LITYRLEQEFECKVLPGFRSLTLLIRHLFTKHKHKMDQRNGRDNTKA